MRVRVENPWRFAVVITSAVVLLAVLALAVLSLDGDEDGTPLTAGVDDTTTSTTEPTLEFGEADVTTIVTGSSTSTSSRRPTTTTTRKPTSPTIVKPAGTSAATTTTIVAECKWSSRAGWYALPGPTPAVFFSVRHPNFVGRQVRFTMSYTSPASGPPTIEGETSGDRVSGKFYVSKANEGGTYVAIAKVIDAGPAVASCTSPALTVNYPDQPQTTQPPQTSTSTP